MGNYNSNSANKPPNMKKSQVKGAHTQDVLLADGSKRQILVLERDRERFCDFTMVFKTIPKNRGGESMISAVARGILHYLITDYMDYRNVCDITAETCACKIHIGKRTAKNHLKELADNGYIKRIRPGTYMVAPHVAMSISARYYDILARAWDMGNIDNIQFEIARLNEKSKEETKRNRDMVKEAGGSRIKHRCTVPEAPEVAATPAAEYSYIEAVVDAEREARTQEEELRIRIPGIPGILSEE